MKIITFLKKDWLVLLFVIFPFVLLLLVWQQLPAEIATHWNIRGEIDGYMQKENFLWFTAALFLGIYVLMAVVPYIDPKPTARFIVRPLGQFRLAIMILLCVLFSLLIFFALGFDVDIPSISMIGAILIILVTGNLMGKFRPNYFVGIRTPWTLENPDIWNRVHRISGKLWVVAALVMLLLFFILNTEVFFIFFLVITLTITFVPVGYSYWLHKKMRQDHAR